MSSIRMNREIPGKGYSNNEVIIDDIDNKTPEQVDEEILNAYLLQEKVEALQTLLEGKDVAQRLKNAVLILNKIALKEEITLPELVAKYK